MRIIIIPTSANYETGKVYGFTVTVVAVAFASNQDRFHTINIGLRFQIPGYTIGGGLNGPYELTSIGNRYHTTVYISIPSEENFSLNWGESVQGELQYIIDYKEGLVLAVDPYLTTDWNVVAQGTITNPIPPIIMIGGILLIIIIISGIIGGIIYLKKKPSQQLVYTPSTSPVTLDTKVQENTVVKQQQANELSASPEPPPKQTIISFCSYCRSKTQIGSIFCQNCGQEI